MMDSEFIRNKCFLYVLKFYKMESHQQLMFVDKQIFIIKDFEHTQLCVHFIFHSSHNPLTHTKVCFPLLRLGQLSFKETGRIGSSPVDTPHHLMYSSPLPFLF